MRKIIKSLCFSLGLGLTFSATTQQTSAQGLSANRASFTALAISYLPTYLFEGAVQLTDSLSISSSDISDRQREEAAYLRADAIDYLAYGEMSSSLDRALEQIRKSSEHAKEMTDEQVASFIITMSETF